MAAVKGCKLFDRFTILPFNGFRYNFDGPTGKRVLFIESEEKHFTLSFEEYLSFKKQYGEVEDIHKELVNYIKYGGFPAIHLQEHPLDNAYTIVRDIYN
mgnify:CR=1 FL=1